MLLKSINEGKTSKNLLGLKLVDTIMSVNILREIKRILEENVIRELELNDIDIGTFIIDPTRKA